MPTIARLNLTMGNVPYASLQNNFNSIEKDLFQLSSKFGTLCFSSSATEGRLVVSFQVYLETENLQQSQSSILSSLSNTGFESCRITEVIFDNQLPRTFIVLVDVLHTKLNQRVDNRTIPEACKGVVKCSQIRQASLMKRLELKVRILQNSLAPAPAPFPMAMQPHISPADYRGFKQLQTVDNYIQAHRQVQFKDQVEKLEFQTDSYTQKTFVDIFKFINAFDANRVSASHHGKGFINHPIFKSESNVNFVEVEGDDDKLAITLSSHSILAILSTHQQKLAMDANLLAKECSEVFATMVSASVNSGLITITFSNNFILASRYKDNFISDINILLYKLGLDIDYKFDKVTLTKSPHLSSNANIDLANSSASVGPRLG